MKIGTYKLFIDKNITNSEHEELVKVWYNEKINGYDSVCFFINQKSCLAENNKGECNKCFLDSDNLYENLKKMSKRIKE